MEIEEFQSQIAEVGSWKSKFAQYYFESFMYGIKEISKKDKDIAEKYKDAYMELLYLLEKNNTVYNNLKVNNEKTNANYLQMQEDYNKVLMECNTLKYQKSNSDANYQKAITEIEQQKKYYESILSIQQQEIQELLTEQEKKTGEKASTSNLTFFSPSKYQNDHKQSNENKEFIFNSSKALEEWILKIKELQEKLIKNSNNIAPIANDLHHQQFNYYSSNGISIESQCGVSFNKRCTICNCSENTLLKLNNDYLRKEIESNRNEIASLFSQIYAYSKQIEDVKIQNTHLETKANSEMDLQISKESMQYQNSINENTSSLKDIKSAFRQLELKYQDMSLSQQYYLKKCSNLEDKIKEQELGYNTAQERVNQMAKDYIEAQHKLKIITNQNCQLTEANHLLSNEHIQLKKCALDIGVNNNTEYKNETYNCIISAYKAKLLEMESQNQNYKSQIGKLSTSAVPSNGSNISLLEICQSLTQENQSLKSQLSSLNDKLNQNEQEYCKVIEQYIQIIQASNASFRNALNDTNHKIEHLQKQKEETDKDLKTNKEKESTHCYTSQLSAPIIHDKLLTIVNLSSTSIASTSLELIKKSENIISNLLNSVELQKCEIEGYITQKNDIKRYSELQISTLNATIKILREECANYKDALSKGQSKLAQLDNSIYQSSPLIEFLREENKKINQENTLLSQRLQASLMKEAEKEKELIHCKSCMQLSPNVDILKCYERNESELAEQKEANHALNASILAIKKDIELFKKKNIELLASSEINENKLKATEANEKARGDDNRVRRMMGLFKTAKKVIEIQSKCIEINSSLLKNKRKKMDNQQ